VTWLGSLLAAQLSEVTAFMLPKRMRLSCSRYRPHFLQKQKVSYAYAEGVEVKIDPCSRLEKAAYWVIKVILWKAKGLGGWTGFLLVCLLSLLAVHSSSIPISCAEITLGVFTKGSLGYLSSMYFSTSLVLGEVVGPFPEIES